MEFSRQETPHYWCGLPFPSPGMDLKEAEDIKKRWQEYTELYKNDLHDPDALRDKAHCDVGKMFSSQV